MRVITMAIAPTPSCPPIFDTSRRTRAAPELATALDDVVLALEVALGAAELTPEGVVLKLAPHLLTSAWAIGV